MKRWTWMTLGVFVALLALPNISDGAVRQQSIVTGPRLVPITAAGVKLAAAYPGLLTDVVIVGLDNPKSNAFGYVQAAPAGSSLNSIIFINLKAIEAQMLHDGLDPNEPGPVQTWVGAVIFHEAQHLLMDTSSKCDKACEHVHVYFAEYTETCKWISGSHELSSWAVKEAVCSNLDFIDQHVWNGVLAAEVQGCINHPSLACLTMPAIPGLVSLACPDCF